MNRLTRTALRLDLVQMALTVVAAAETLSLAEKSKLFVVAYEGCSALPEARQRRNRRERGERDDTPSSDAEKPVNLGKPWTLELDADVAAQWLNGARLSDLAAKQGRSEGSIVARVVHLGLAFDRDAANALAMSSGAERVSAMNPNATVKLAEQAEGELLPA